MTMIIAPTEPPAFKAIADVVSMAPERMGADALFSSTHWGMVGVQRKEVKDLIASVQDGRLAREVAQMQRLGLAVLIVEGTLRWTQDGELVDAYTRWTKSQHRGLIRSVQSKGVWVESSLNVTDTVSAVLDLRAWCEKKIHNTLDRRPKPTGAWGKADQHDFALHLIQGVDGVGPGLAQAVLDRFGKVPWAWECTFEELLEVPGLGKVRATAMWEALGATVPAAAPRKKKLSEKPIAKTAKAARALTPTPRKRTAA